MGNCIAGNSIQKKDDKIFQKFTLKGIKTYCKVLSIYDGDTITIGCKVWGKYFKLKIRMFGYDSPEMKPPKRSTENKKSIRQKKLKNF